MTSSSAVWKHVHSDVHIGSSSSREQSTEGSSSALRDRSIVSLVNSAQEPPASPLSAAGSFSGYVSHASASSSQAGDMDDQLSLSGGQFIMPSVLFDESNESTGTRGRRVTSAVVGGDCRSLTLSTYQR